ncbi:uncharacterized protein RCC_06555 [Ramularia collo-cygni]|uniref:Rhodopsin domain-containing protein n=1 Tax=Ramularia collo-cygni TaxID=112498 RepID=A0A2D3V7G2_9PEZI|nr:uncharacterized protein RCC_06555 [Ramularia collo-cygni]CZT20697.1 uncharacterized protein RCC_06555 [Ramularia collo-cygni]
MPSFHLEKVSAGIVIACTTASIWSLLISLIRLFLRLKISGPLGWDDATCAAATLFGVAESCTALLAVHYGLGIPQNEIGEFEPLYKLVWVAGQLYALSVGFSVLSITCFIARLTKTDQHQRIIHSIMIAIGVWMVISELLIALGCPTPRPWDISDRKCLNKWYIWLSHTVICTMFEILNIKVALLIVWNLQMPFRPKAVVFLSFSLRLLVLPPALVRLQFLEVAIAKTDVGAYRARANLLSQIVMHSSIILATIPCAKPFFALFDGGVYRTPRDMKPEPATEPEAAGTGIEQRQEFGFYYESSP